MSDWRPVRLKRWTLGLAILPVLVLSPLILWLLTPREPEPVSSAPDPVLEREPEPDPGPSLDPALDPDLSLMERVVCIKEFTRASDDPAPLLELLASLGAVDPNRAQVHSAALAALARYPDDARVQYRFRTGLKASAPREERLVILSVLASLPARCRWRVPLLRRALSRDRDAAVRQAAKGVLDRIQEPPIPN